MTGSEKKTLLLIGGAVLAFALFNYKKVVETFTGKYEITPVRKAFLKTINWAEGSPGYNQLFSYVPYNNLGPHPGIKIPFGSTYSTAAGAYQFLFNTWHEVIKRLGIDDFMSAENQDQAALERINQRGALQDLDKGDIASAVNKLSWEWASLPPARYGGQSARSVADVISKYNEFLKTA